MTRLVSLVGARPQFVKLGPICEEISRRLSTEEHRFEHVIVHSGQHYDSMLSDVFFEELALPRPDVNLGIGSGPHGLQTGRMMERFEALLLETRPDAVMVYGDTNTTLAGALVTAKLNLPLVHLEAGLRSFNRAMPEEINRIATDHVSTLLLAPTALAMTLLEKEGLGARSVLTGDVNFDAVLTHSARAAVQSTVLRDLNLTSRRYVLVTAHRSENAESGRLDALLSVLVKLPARELTVVFPVHPRTSARFGDVLDGYRHCKGLHLLEPVGYLDMLHLTSNALIVITDSGGLQKEAFFLDTPCITLRGETEWVETVEAGANFLCPMEARNIRDSIDEWLRRIDSGEVRGLSRRAGHPFGEGRAAAACVDAIKYHLRTT